MATVRAELSSIDLLRLLMRPKLTIKNRNLPATVYVSCQVLGIDTINEATMDFRLILLVVAVWKDSRLNLTHLVSEHAGTFPSDLNKKIWKPNFGYPNTKLTEAFYDNTEVSSVNILSDKSLIGGFRMNFLVDCPMELHHYPIDVQICQFLILPVFIFHETINAHENKSVSGLSERPWLHQV
ncbi:glycine receptor subunit beta-like [Centruroides sculpturatus]|uniref:glycine receptor subunit beta-like n=1 Tax=Centruroides sculpturatus TaxID=218467 RepID=UPI000C6E934E|nr:glycine receptor subunit beta-like [Centruroides sculpturatus]